MMAKQFILLDWNVIDRTGYADDDGLSSINPFIIFYLFIHFLFFYLFTCLFNQEPLQPVDAMG